MLRVEILVNGTRTARMMVKNTSDLADVSNYDYYIDEIPNADMNIPVLGKSGSIKDHNRNQSAWNLVMAVLKDQFEVESVWKDMSDDE